MCARHKICTDNLATVRIAKLAIFPCYSAALDQDVKHLQQTLTAECLHCNNFPASISRVCIIDLTTHLGTLSAGVARQTRDSEFSLEKEAKRNKSKTMNSHCATRDLRSIAKSSNQKVLLLVWKV